MKVIVVTEEQLQQLVDVAVHRAFDRWAPKQQLYTLKDAQAIIGCSRTKLRNLIAEGRIDMTDDGRHITRESLERYITTLAPIKK